MQLLLAILPSVGIVTYEVREHQIESYLGMLEGLRGE